MGEAKWRAKNDPNFGKVPKNSSNSTPNMSDGFDWKGWAANYGFQPPQKTSDIYFDSNFDFDKYAKSGLEGTPERGLVISSPIIIKGNSLSSQGGLEDRLAWPTNNGIFIGPGPDEEYLESTGILVRPHMTFSGSGQLAEIAGQAHYSAFEKFDFASPGMWALASGENSFQWDKLQSGPVDGAVIQLLRAIPVPDREVPLAEVLEFRERRRDEALNLRQEIDNLSAAIRQSENPEAELAARQKQIEAACADLLKAGMAWKFPVRISDLKCGIEIDLGQVVQYAASGWAAGATFALPTVGAMVGGALSLVKITAAVKRQKILPRSTPYQYVYNFHKELF